jgi:hypothetical protein
MTEAEKLATWLYANKDKQGTPEFEEKKAQFFAADAAPKASPMKVAPRGEDTVRILQNEFMKEYERPAATPEEQSRKEANLAALTRELANLKAQPPAVEKQGPPAEEESAALSSLRQDMGQIEAKRQEQQPSDMRLNAQIAGAAIGAVPGAVQQAAVLRDATGRGIRGSEGRIANLLAQRMQPPASTVADLASDVIAGEMPQGVSMASLNQNATRFYREYPHEIEYGNMAAGGRGTYAYGRSFGLPVDLALQAVDLKDAQRLAQERRAGTLEAKSKFPNATIYERPQSGVLYVDEKQPRERLIISNEPLESQPRPAAPTSQTPQPRSALPPGQPLTGAPQPRMTAGTNPFQPGTAALLQAPPVEPSMPPMSAGTPPPGMGVRTEPTMGAQPGPAMLGPAALGEAPRPTSATRGPIRSGLDAVTGMFARNVAEPAQRILSALPIIPKTLGGMQIGGGGAEMATGMKQGDAGKVGTGAAEMLGGGLSMFGRTAPAGMTISILTELYRNARTPEDRQKIMDTLNQMMFGQQQTM